MKEEEIVAREIVVKMQYQTPPLTFEQAKHCAIIASNYVLENLEDHTGEDIKFWNEVKSEIRKL